jgi:hypothetical protein
LNGSGQLAGPDTAPPYGPRNITVATEHLDSIGSEVGNVHRIVSSQLNIPRAV